MNFIYFIGAVIILFIGFIFVAIRLKNDFNRIMIKLDVLKIKVESAKTSRELMAYVKELEIINRECFNRTIKCRIVEILAIIKTKNSFFIQELTKE